MSQLAEVAAVTTGVPQISRRLCCIALVGSPGPGTDSAATSGRGDPAMNRLGACHRVVEKSAPVYFLRINMSDLGPLG